MATVASSRSPYTADQGFFIRMSLGIAGLIVFGFLQWAARGFVVPATVPIWVHIHALAMVAWLALFVTQNMLAGRGNLPLHRTLGWASLALVIFVVLIGSFTGIKATELHRVPPFFTNAYFLALTQIEVVLFAAMFAAAITMRRQTQWHRRLMLGATVLLMEPGFGRLLPMPLLGPVAGPWVETAFQLAVLAIVMIHDRRTLGRIHPATLCSAGVIFAAHVVIVALSLTPSFIVFAESIAAG